MKTICTQENLKNGLAVVGRIISSTNTLPILNNILIRAEDGVMKISSTNLEVAITTQVRCKVEEEGETTVLGKAVSELVNNFPNQNITLQTQNTNLKLDTENYHTLIKTLPTEDFPLIPKLENGMAIVLDAEELKQAIDQVAFAASPNQTQPEIAGILLNSDGNQFKVVATDRYRLAEKTISQKNSSPKPESVIVPHKTIIELSRIIGGQKGEVEMVFNETQASLKFLETKIISRLVDGQYPDYKQIIPTSFNTVAVVDKNSFINGLKTTAVFGQSSNSVKINLSAKTQQLVLKAESSELGESLVELPAEITGDGGEIVFNIRYVLDSLNSIISDKVSVKIINDDSAGVITPTDANDYVYLVMPIKS